MEVEAGRNCGLKSTTLSQQADVRAGLDKTNQKG
jgi:hypothetical protein